MYEFPNVNKASDLIWNIVHKLRCASCDNLQGTRVRYPCGHSSCEDCANVVNECLDCPVDQNTSNFTNFKHDPVLTKLATSTFNLKTTFEKTFKTSVQQKRLSEQLKIEKEVFPECIQAEHKYFNKRKSTSFSHRKTLSPKFPGEVLCKKMSDPILHVKSWLEQSENITVNKPDKIENNTRIMKSKPLNRKGRVPFSDIEIGNTNIQLNKAKTFLKVTPIKSRKRTYFDKEDYVAVNSGKRQASPKKVKLDSNKENKVTKPYIEDELIEIDEKESIPDKDEEAQLAVLEADKNMLNILNENEDDEQIKGFKEQCKPLNTYLDIDLLSIKKEKTKHLIDSDQALDTKRKNVPFLHLGKLHKEQPKTSSSNKTEKNIITRESDDFVINVTVSECSDERIACINMKSQSVQTDDVVDNIPSPTGSEDLFAESPFVSDGMRINEAVNLDASTSHANVLCPINPRKNVNKWRPKRYVASSDSSEKENKAPDSPKKDKKDKSKMKKKFIKKKRL